MDAVQETLRKTPYFADLAPPQVTTIARAVVRRKYERGEFVFHEGDTCMGLYVVESGRVRVFKVSPEGREQVLLVAEAGEAFNEVAVFDDGPNPASVEALEPTVLLLLPKSALLSIVRAEPDVGRAFTRVFASHLRRLALLVEELSFKTVTGRVARILLEQLPSPAGDTAQEPAPRRLTQREIAAMAGTAREVVARALKLLEQQGAIRMERGRIVIADPEQLAGLGR